MLQLLGWFFFPHLLTSEDPVWHQDVISTSFHHPGPLHKFSLQSIYNLETNKQTNKQTHESTLPKHW